jgi:endonuclease YncB( thermonuclease family)
VAGKKKITIKDSKSLVERLKKVGLSGGIVSGVLLGMILGGAGVRTIDDSFYKNKAVFPESAQKIEIIDGDTFITDNGLSVRLLGIDAPNRGEPGFDKATKSLSDFTIGKPFWLEYDRYQLDQFGRVLAWVWTNCESKPIFLPANYMEKSKNASNPGLTDNPEGCKKGKLVNEEMIKAGMAKTVKYGDRGELKYEKRIKYFE